MNKNIFVVVATTLLGTAGGFALGWLVAKKKYEGLADREVESVKKAFEEHYQQHTLVNADDIKYGTKQMVPTNGKDDNSPLDATSIDTKTTGSSNKKSNGKSKSNKTLSPTEKKYVDYGKPYRSDSVDAKIVDKEPVSSFGKIKNPYVISPGEYNSSSYATKTYKYYSVDGVIADEDDCIVKNYEEFIGPSALMHIGDYEPDSVYIRNDKEQIDYEIILIESSYYKSNPTKNFTVEEEDSEED